MDFDPTETKFVIMFDKIKSYGVDFMEKNQFKMVVRWNSKEIVNEY